MVFFSPNNLDTYPGNSNHSATTVNKDRNLKAKRLRENTHLYGTALVGEIRPQEGLDFLGSLTWNTNA